MTEAERSPKDLMEASFLAALPQIENVVRKVGRRRGMSEISIQAAMELPDPAPLPDQAAFLRERSARLEKGVCRALATLEPRDRAFVHLRFEHAWSAKEIGLAFGLPTRFVYQRTESILRTVRDALLREGLTWRDASDTLGRSTWTVRWPEVASTPVSAASLPKGLDAGDRRAKAPTARHAREPRRAEDVTSASGHCCKSADGLRSAS